ncbi:hypothetical protein G7Z17_g9198 [Cylindrodendrum hubeiense]|uniref:Uncharacterized protein n=1 Tax=Cylindrodendrum hubeiense TaxID=595255 RepID=A0A9P5H522_9HYPO|nr:hypothetical protein G7Z17_g9198 [Cylindrodendrum hubeiense]
MAAVACDRCAAGADSPTEIDVVGPHRWLAAAHGAVMTQTCKPECTTECTTAADMRHAGPADQNRPRRLQLKTMACKMQVRTASVMDVLTVDVLTAQQALGSCAYAHIPFPLFLSSSWGRPDSQPFLRLSCSPSLRLRQLPSSISLFFPRLLISLSGTSTYSSTTRTSDTVTSLKPTTIDESSTTTHSATETSTSTAAAAGGGKSDDGDKGNSLSRDQVAGISVGVLAAAGLAIGAILLARYYRRRKYPNLKNGFLPMRDTWGYKPDRSETDRTNSWIAHQIRPPLDSFPPPPLPTYIRPTASYNRSSYKPDVIGLAISPAHSRVTTQTATSRRMSRLLPAKPVLPVLPLNISKKNSLQPHDEWPGPQHYGGPSRQENPPRLPPLEIGPLASVASPTVSKQAPPPPPKLQIPTSNNPRPPSSHYQRESTLTEFEDDDRGSMSPSAQVWRPPPTTPLSAATYYVADQYGNWVLGDPRNATQAVESRGVAPKPPPKDNVNLPLAGDSNGKKQDIVSPLSADALKASLAPPAEIIPGRWQTGNVPPKPMGPRAQPQSNVPFSGQSNPPSQVQQIPRRNSSNRRSLTRNLTRPRASGSSDATTITTSSEGSISDPSPALELPGNLSPVAESPHSGSGRSPVTYPKIPSRDPRRISGVTTQGWDANKKTAPPPSRPMVYYPPGQPSPTLGTMQPPSGPGMASNAAQKVGRKPVANPGLLRSGSPTMRVVEPSPEPEEKGPAPPPKPRAPAFLFNPPYPQPLNTRQSSQFQHAGSASGPDPAATQPYQQPPQQPPQQPAQYQYQQQQPYQSHYQQQEQQQPYQYQQQQQQQQQPQPQRQYQPYQPTQRQSQRQSQQQPQRQPPYQQPPHQQSQQHQQQQPQPQPQRQYQQQPPQDHHHHHHQWHPLQPPRQPNPDYDPSRGSDQSVSTSSSLLAKRLGPNRAANMAIPTDPARAKWRRENAGSQEESTSGRDSSLPATPTWLPRLTPTRRGKDLFLNVQ